MLRNNAATTRQYRPDRIGRLTATHEGKILLVLRFLESPHPGMPMTRVVLLLLTIIGVMLIFMAKSSLLLGIGLLCGIVGFFGLVLSLAAARVSASARPEASMATVEDLATLRRPAARELSRPERASKAPVGPPDRTS